MTVIRGTINTKRVPFAPVSSTGQALSPSTGLRTGLSKDGSWFDKLTTNGSRGFTLVEILVAMAVTATISGLVGTAIYQSFAVSDRGNDTLSALHSLQNVAHWVSTDAQEASSAVGGASLTLTLPDASTRTYALSGTDLIRTVDPSQITVARSVTALSFDVDGRVVTMTITSAPTGGWGVSEQKMYKVYLRPAP